MGNVVESIKVGVMFFFEDFFYLLRGIYNYYDL